MGTMVGIITAAIGAVAALALLTLIYLLDTRIKDVGDLTQISDRPVLGQIPIIVASEETEQQGYESADSRKEAEKDE